MARPRSPAPYPGLRSGATGGQGNPDAGLREGEEAEEKSLRRSRKNIRARIDIIADLMHMGAPPTLSSVGTFNTFRNRLVGSRCRSDNRDMDQDPFA